MGLGVEAPDDAPVDDPDATVAQQQHVPSVHVGVERSPPNRGEEEGPDHLFDQGRGVDPERGGGGPVVDGHPVQELHGQYVGAGELGEGCRHHDQGQVDLIEQQGEGGQGPGLVAQVELFADLLSEPGQHLHQRTRGLVPGLPGHQLQQGLEEVQIGGHQVLDPRSQDLDRHDAPVVQHGLVDHGDRGLADGDWVEPSERIAEAHPQVRFDDGANSLVGNRRSRVQARPEFVGEGLAEDARGRCHQLPELHVRPAQILEGAAEGLGQDGQGKGARPGVAKLAQGQSGEVTGADGGDVQASA